MVTNDGASDIRNGQDKQGPSVAEAWTKDLKRLACGWLGLLTNLSGIIGVANQKEMGGNESKANEEQMMTVTHTILLSFLITHPLLLLGERRRTESPGQAPRRFSLAGAG